MRTRAEEVRSNLICCFMHDFSLFKIPAHARCTFLSQITLPLRFILLTAHFVIVLAVLFDVQATTVNLTYPQLNPNIVGSKNTRVTTDVVPCMHPQLGSAIGCCALEIISNLTVAPPEICLMQVDRSLLRSPGMLRN